MLDEYLVAFIVVHVFLSEFVAVEGGQVWDHILHDQLFGGFMQGVEDLGYLILMLS